MEEIDSTRLLALTLLFSISLIAFHIQDRQIPTINQSLICLVFTTYNLWAVQPTGFRGDNIVIYHILNIYLSWINPNRLITIVIADNVKSFYRITIATMEGVLQAMMAIAKQRLLKWSEASESNNLMIFCYSTKISAIRTVQ